MKSRILLFCFTWLFVMYAGAQTPTTLTGWTFPNNPANSNADAYTSVPNNSAAFITCSQTVAYTYSGATTNSARATGWNNGNASKYWQIELNTSGYSVLALSSKQRSSSTGPKDFKPQYRIGTNGTWTDVSSEISITVADNYTIGVLTDISLPTACNNQPSVFIRWIMSSSTAVGGGSVGSTGASNIDDIKVSGTLSNEVFYFRSKQNGNFNAASTWESSTDNTNWSNATFAPTYRNNDITIQSGHTVTIAATDTIDQTTVNGTLIYSDNSGSTPRINNGTGVDLIINGTFEDAGPNSITWAASATWELGSSATIVRTRGTSSNYWRDHYNNGISNIPATANWVIRKTGSDSPLLSSIGGMYYPNLTIENNTATTWTTGTNSSFNGSSDYPRVKGNLDIGGSGTGNVSFLNENTHATAVLVAGNLTVKIGSTLRNYGTGFEIQGNLVVNGTISYDADADRKLVFSGASSQSISGSGTLNIYALEINKSANSLSLSRGITVDNNLSLTEGIITSTNTNLLTLADNSTSTNGKSTSFINGPIKKIGNDAFTFHVGKGNNYQPVSISAPQNTTDAFLAEYFNAGQSLGNNTDPSITNLSTCEYWALNRVAGNSEITATLGWNSHSCNRNNAEIMRIVEWEGTKWKNLDIANYSGSSNSGTSTSLSNLKIYNTVTLANVAQGASVFTSIQIPEDSSHTYSFESSDTTIWLKFTADTNKVFLRACPPLNNSAIKVNKLFLYSGNPNNLQLLSVKDKINGDRLEIIKNNLNQGDFYYVKITQPNFSHGWFAIEKDINAFYIGEYQINLDNFFWDGSLVTSFTFEVVSFPFAPECYNLNQTMNDDGVRKFTVPNPNINENTVNFSTISTVSPEGTYATGIAWEINSNRHIYKTCTVFPGFNHSLSHSPPTALVSNFIRGFDPTSPRIVLPHTILKLKIISDTDPQMHDELEFFVDNTRGQLNYYPYSVPDQSGVNEQNYDLLIRPSVLPSQCSGYNHFYSANSNSSWYNSIYGTQNGTIDFFPSDEVTLPLLYPVPEILGTTCFPYLYLHPAPYTIPQLNVFNAAGTYPSGYDNEDPPQLFYPNIASRKYHKYVIDNSFDISTLNLSNNVFYNPSSTIIQADLHFPSGYTFKTLELPGRLADRALIESNTDAIGKGIDPRNINVPITKISGYDNDYVYAYGGMDSIPTYYVGNGVDINNVTLTIDPCVSIWDAKLVVYPNCTLKYYPRQLYGNYQIINKGGIIEKHFEDLSTCPEDQPCYNNQHYDVTDLTISANTTWNLDYINSTYKRVDGIVRISGTITIEEGARLTIDSSVVLIFGSNGKIVLKPGAQLNAEGKSGYGVLFTSMCYSMKWKGIEVQGNPNFEPWDNDHQGMVILRNATIENAETGVNVLNAGIIRAASSNFKNNKKAVSIHPESSGSFEQVLNSFTANTFSVDNNTPFTLENPDMLIDLQNSSGAHFFNNTFTSSRGTIEERGVGINAVNSSFHVIPRCNCSETVLEGDPCPIECYEKNVFNGLTYGINATYGTGIWIDEAIFNNTLKGVLLIGITSPTVTRNNFNGIYESESYGLYLYGCDGYTIEENHFDNGPAGLFVNATGSNANLVYKNEFTNTTGTPSSVYNQAASVALGNNDGLQYFCNKFNGNAYDIAVCDDGSIKVSQGDDNNPTGNMFLTSSCSNSDNRIHIENTFPPPPTYLYYYNTNNTGDVTNPGSCITSIVVATPTNDPFYEVSQCLSNITNPIIPPIESVFVPSFRDVLLQQSNGTNNRSRLISGSQKQAGLTDWQRQTLRNRIICEALKRDTVPGVVDSLITMLQSDSDYTAKYSLIPLLLRQNRYSNISAELSELAIQSLLLSVEEQTYISNYILLQQIVMAVQQATDKQRVIVSNSGFLQSLTANDNTSLSARARALLKQAGLDNTPEKFILPLGSENVRFANNNNSSEDNKMLTGSEKLNFKLGDYFKVFPNPVKDKLNVGYTLETECCNVVVELVSMDGRVIQSKVIQGNVGLASFDTKMLGVGDYIVIIRNNDTKVFSSVVNVIK